jgi:hypothetical protein
MYQEATPQITMLRRFKAALGSWHISDLLQKKPQLLDFYDKVKKI